MTPQEIEALRIEALKDKVETLSNMVDILKAERDALAARIQTAERVEKIFSEMPELTFDDCLKLFADEIRNVQAEAGRSGYLQGLLAAPEEMEEYGAADVRNAEREADKYAATVRQGGAE